MAEHDDLPYIVIERRSGGVGAFLWGALVGAGVALLLAPRSGEAIRDELRTGARRLRDGAERTVRDLQSSVTGTIDGVRSEVTGRVDAAREAFEAGRRAARDTRTEMERRVHDSRSRTRGDAAAVRRGQELDGPDGSAPSRSYPGSDAEPEANLGV